MIETIVTSSNKTKINATERATVQLGHGYLQVFGSKTESLVNEQPFGIEEIALGAENRMIGAEKKHPNAIIVSIENGVNRQMQDLAVIRVRGPHSGDVIALSDRVAMPPEVVAAAAERNFRHVTAGQVLAEQTGSRSDDPHAHLSGGKTTRLDLLVPPLVRALKPIIEHELNHGNTFRVEVRGVVAKLRIGPLNDKLTGCIYEPHRDVAFARQAAKELAARLTLSGGEILLTPEGKGGGLVLALAEETNLPYEVARKGAKSYMLKPIVNSVREECVTDNGNAQNFCLDQESVRNLRGKRVIIFDDVISTGGSIEAMKRLCEQVGAEVVAVACVFTEGTRRPDVVSLNHLPLYPNKA